jgi:uncharacterized membrane protein YgdD (TMEM256/DUF423 family)
MRRLPAALAATIAALSVALGAYAVHAAQAQDRQRLALAAAFAFGHALALLLLHSRQNRLATAARSCFMVGIALFSGSLAAAALFGTTTRWVPFGGSLLILGWLVASVDFLRKD